MLGKSPSTEQLTANSRQMSRAEPVTLPVQDHAHGSREKRVEAASAPPGSEGRPKQPPKSQGAPTTLEGAALPGSWGSMWVLNGLICPGISYRNACASCSALPGFAASPAPPSSLHVGQQPGCAWGHILARCSQLQPSSARFGELQCPKHKPGGPSPRPRVEEFASQRKCERYNVVAEQ